MRNWDVNPARCGPSSKEDSPGKRKLSHVHAVVVVCNLVSIQTRLPPGLYELKKLKGNVILRFGVKGESYIGHTGSETGVERKFIEADECRPMGGRKIAREIKMMGGEHE